MILANRSFLFALVVAGILVGCASSQYPGLTIYSPPVYYKQGLHEECGKHFHEWERLARETIYPDPESRKFCPRPTNLE
jgi:hypothetical protein